MYWLNAYPKEVFELNAKPILTLVAYEASICDLDKPPEPANPKEAFAYWLNTNPNDTLELNAKPIETFVAYEASSCDLDRPPEPANPRDAFAYWLKLID